MENHDVLQLVHNQLLYRLRHEYDHYGEMDDYDIKRLATMGVDILVDDLVERSLELLRKREEIK